jgi:hypothetical protein
LEVRLGSIGNCTNIGKILVKFFGSPERFPFGRDTTPSDTSKHPYEPEYRFRPGLQSNKYDISGPTLKTVGSDP